MGKSLTDVAKAILQEGAVPSVSSSQSNPDRDATSSNPNKATLRPGSRGAEGRFSNPGATPPMAPGNGVQDLGPALVNNTDIPPSAKAAGSVGKDTSGSSQSRKGAEAGDKKPVVNPGANSPKQMMEEDIEISEELEAFIEEQIEAGLSEEEIAQAIEENFELVSEEDEILEEETEEESYKVDMSEHVEALFAGEELSEEFKEKAKTIFEAAVEQKLAEEIKMLEEAYAETLEEQVSQIQEELSTNVDDYLNYVVEQWVSENEVAIEAGLRSELTEEFISGLRNLFAEHYIDIPEEKISVVEEMSSKVEELEAKLNEEIERNVALSKMLNESTQQEILSDACDGLTTTQAEKLKALAEGLDFTSADEYAQKINILRESYFNAPVSTNNVLDNNEVENDGRGMISENLQGPMANYVKALGRTLPK